MYTLYYIKYIVYALYFFLILGYDKLKSGKLFNIYIESNTKN